MTIKVGIVGATGYTGAELLRLLSLHEAVEVVWVGSRKEAGVAVSDYFENLRGRCALRFSDYDTQALLQCEVVFFATPHAVCMQQAPFLLENGVKVIDLSADFRLKKAELFTKWYGVEHVAQEWLAEAVYGLPELNREAIKHARLVAAAGCYPTAVQLGFKPLLEAGLVEAGRLIADVKSGVSGAGREAKVANLFSEVSDNFKAYALTGHRHQPEIEQQLSLLAKQAVSCTFVPHLLPMIRGIEATLYAPLLEAVSLERLQVLYEQCYQSEYFVDVMPLGSHPQTRTVRGSNFVRMAVHQSQNQALAVVSVVEDNLLKGAAGQAVQCMNLMFGLEETLGLTQMAYLP